MTDDPRDPGYWDHPDDRDQPFPPWDSATADQLSAAQGGAA